MVSFIIEIETRKFIYQHAIPLRKDITKKEISILLVKITPVIKKLARNFNLKFGYVPKIDIYIE